MECNVDETEFDLKQHWVPFIDYFWEVFWTKGFINSKTILKIVTKFLLNEKLEPKPKGSFQNQEPDNISLNLHK
jgi:hypothetical protein